MTSIRRWRLCRVAAAACLLPLATIAAVPDGAIVYQMRCAACHNSPADRVPARDALAQRTPEDVLAALTDGAMKPQGSALSADEKRVVSMFVTNKAFGASVQPQGTENRCQGRSGPISIGKDGWNGWGVDVENTRFQPVPGIKAADIPRLKVKWTFAYPASITYGQPTVAGKRLFVSTVTGRVYALDAETGCTYWAIEPGSPVRSAISVAQLPRGSSARYAAYFGDEKAYAWAVDAETGKTLWKTRVHQHPLARITGTPTLYEGRLYVPVASWEESAGRMPDYECCTFRGAVVALDALTGKEIWRADMIPEPAKPFRKNSSGTQMYGPAGAAVWMAPTIDARRRAVYVGTGNSYTDSDAATANAIVALNMDTGRVLWARQMTSGDNYLAGCRRAGEGSCPSPMGPDVDFGSSPILRRLPNGRDILLCGQKSGVLWAVDPDQKGEVVWSVKAGQGGALGGIEWGPAADRNRIYVAIADESAKGDSSPGGIEALDIASGKQLWKTPAPKVACSWGRGYCNAAQSAAVTAIPDVVFSGALDGHLRAYSAKDGTIVWDFDTAEKPYKTVNGMEAVGGSIDSGGATIANGMIFLNSGYARIVGQRGNVLIALSVDGK